MQVSRLISKAIKGMEVFIEWAITAIVGIMVINTALGVFFRYVLQNSLTWTEELGRYLMVWAGFLGAVLALKEGSHVSVTAVVSLFPPTIKRGIEFSARLVMSIFLLVILVMSFKHLGTLSIQKSSAMEIPMVIPYLAVTVGLALMSVENAVIIAEFFSKPGIPGEVK